LEALDRPRLVDVERHALRPTLDDVDQPDRLEDVVLGQPLRGGRPVEPGADHRHLPVAPHDQPNFSMIASAYSPVPTAVGSFRFGFMSYVTLFPSATTAATAFSRLRAARSSPMWS